MKRYNEYTKKELAAVENIQILIDLEIAYAGILPVEEPKPVSNPKEKLQKTETFYEVYGLLFTNAADAQVVAALNCFQTGYDYNGAGYDYKYAEPHYNSGTVNVVKLYKKDEVKALRSELTQLKQQKEAYDEQKTAYDKYIDSIGGIRSAVWKAHTEATHFVAELETATKQYQKYLMLADNDPVIASRFFTEAYQNYPDIIEEVLPDRTES